MHSYNNHFLIFHAAKLHRSSNIITKPVPGDEKLYENPDIVCSVLFTLWLHWYKPMYSDLVGIHYIHSFRGRFTVITLTPLIQNAP